MSNKNIVLSASGAGEAPTYVEDVFSTYLYTGTGSISAITNNIDLSGKGGLVWSKIRNASDQHRLCDTARGATNLLSTDTTGAQYTNATSLTAFNNNGYSISPGGLLDLSYNYVSWTFRKQPKFFDIVTYTGTGVARTVSHNLGCTPGMIIVKSTNATNNWAVWHKSLTDSSYFLLLNLTNAQALNNAYWNSTAPTSTVFTVGDKDATNQNGNTYVAYLFADSNSGGFGASGTDSVVACGSYTGNSTSQSISLGWEPQYLIIKNASSAASWLCVDNMRRFSVAGDNPVLFPNLSAAESTSFGSFIQPRATGFNVSIDDPSFNLASNTYIYLAIRRGPMKTPTDATKVFYAAANTGSGGGDTGNRGAGRLVNSGFDVDLGIMYNRGGSNIYWNDRMRGTKINLNSTSGSAESAGTIDGAWLDYSGAFEDVFWGDTAGTNTIIDYAFRRAPSFFDVVCYTGTGSATTVAHNLGVAPELMIIKKRSAADSWAVYSATEGYTRAGNLNSTSDFALNGTTRFNAAPTSSVFSVGNNSETNASTATYVAYLFATLAGISKVGSYTGTGTTNNIDCGFTNGARFVMIKRTDSTGDWYVWDTARGIVSGNDPYFLMNTGAAETTNTDYIDPYSAGFQLSSTAPAALNANGGTFIFLAIA